MTEDTRGRRDRGAVIPFVAISLAVLVLMTAFAVDLGRQMLRRRDIQAVADVVSIDLARNLNGQPVSWYTNPSNTAWQTQITQSRERNDFRAPDSATHRLSVEYGEVNQATRVFTALGAAAIPTAVRVTVTDTIDYFFAPGQGSATRSAVAGYYGLVDWQMGSFLAAVSPLQQGVLNGLLGQAFVGAPFSLTAVSYQGLAAGEVTLFDLATELGFATPDEMLESDVEIRDYVLATADILSAQGGNVAAVTALNSIHQAISSSQTVQLGDLVYVEQGSASDAANASINVLELLTGSASLINGNSFVNVNGLNAGVPGVTSVNVSMQVIQRQVICLNCNIGTQRRNSQVQLTITPTLNVTTPVLVPLLGLLNGALTGTTQIQTTVAGALGEATAIRCGTAKGVDLGVSPEPVSVVASETLRLRLLGIDVLRVDVSNASATATGSAGSAAFDYTNEFLPPVGTGTPVRLGSAPLGLNNLLTATGHATLLGGTVPLGTLVNSVNAVLSPVLNQLDTVVLSEISKALGVDLGGADIGAMDMRCVGPTLLG